MAVAGPHRVTVDTLDGDPLAAAALNRVVQATMGQRMVATALAAASIVYAKLPCGAARLFLTSARTRRAGSRGSRATSQPAQPAPTTTPEAAAPEARTPAQATPEAQPVKKTPLAHQPNQEEARKENEATRERMMRAPLNGNSGFRLER